MANALLSSVAELTAWACRGVRYLQRHPELVVNCFRHVGLPVNQPSPALAAHWPAPQSNTPVMEPR
jgi:hypothetical protein